MNLLAIYVFLSQKFDWHTLGSWWSLNIFLSHVFLLIFVIWIKVQQILVWSCWFNPFSLHLFVYTYFNVILICLHLIFKVKNRKILKMCEICSRITNIATVLVSFFLTSNRFHTWFWCFIVLVIHSWLWTSKCQLGSYRDIPKTGFKGFSWKIMNSFKVRLNFILTLSTTNLYSYPLSSDFKMCWFQIQRSS